MKKEKRDVRATIRVSENTLKKIKEMAAETKKSQADVIEILVKENQIFTKEELKQIKFASYTAIEEVNKVGNMNITMFYKEIERQEKIYNSIINKVKKLQEYYK